MDLKSEYVLMGASRMSTFRAAASISITVSRATQSVWCGDVADLAEPLYELMGNEVRASHVVGYARCCSPRQRARCTRGRSELD
jgi:hypothetical protein